jgi:hypothetical protein
MLLEEDNVLLVFHAVMYCTGNFFITGTYNMKYPVNPVNVPT